MIIKENVMKKITMFHKEIQSNTIHWDHSFSHISLTFKFTQLNENSTTQQGVESGKEGKRRKEEIYSTYSGSKDKEYNYS